MFAGPANPRATLLMLAGGDGTVEIASARRQNRPHGQQFPDADGRPLWLAQGFAFATSSPRHPR